MKDLIKSRITESIEIKTKLLSETVDKIQKVAILIINTLKKGNKILICGNGGSAADAQHIACELSGKFYLDRSPLPAIALHCNTSSLTAIANDYSFDEIFSRQVEALGREGDILIGISTSGSSENVIQALKQAKKKKIITIGLIKTGKIKMKDLCDFSISVPSQDTPRIQEAHILIGHIICEIVEKELYGKK